MQTTVRDIDVVQLVSRCEEASLDQRLKMRPEVDRAIRALAGRGKPVPSRLRQLQARLEDEAYEDMFDNMPV